MNKKGRVSNGMEREERTKLINGLSSMGNEDFRDSFRYTM